MATNWNWFADDPATGRQVSFYTSAGPDTPEQLLEHVREHYHALNYTNFKCERATYAPRIVRAVPPQYFQFGIIDAMKADEDSERNSLRRNPDGSVSTFPEKRRSLAAERVLRRLSIVRDYREPGH